MHQEGREVYKVYQAKEVLKDQQDQRGRKEILECRVVKDRKVIKDQKGAKETKAIKVFEVYKANVETTAWDCT